MPTTRTSSLTSRAIPILAYHHFEPTSWKYSLDPVIFDEHLSYLQSKGYVLLNLRDYSQSEGLALSTNSLILTFNGAFKSIETILPILQKYKAKATIFVPSAHVGKKITWLNGQENTLTLLDWEELRNLSNMGFEIASHGHEHLQLDVAPEVLARHDISYSKILLEDQLGKPCISFAYPYGYYNSSVRDLVRSAGFALACTLDERVSTSESDLFALPRLTMTSELDTSKLKSLIKYKDSGQLNAYSLIKANVSRQLRRWKTPLREAPLEIYEGTQVKEAVPSLTPPALAKSENTCQQPITSVLNASSGQPQSGPEVLETLNPQTETTMVTAFMHLQEPLLKDEHTLSREDTQQLEFQGEFLASCKAALRAHPYQTLEEYQQLALATQQLQKAQEGQMLFANFEETERIYEAFTSATQRHLEMQVGIQREHLQKHVASLKALKNTPIQNTVERVKTLIESYLIQLEHGRLQETDIQSTDKLVKNLQQRLLSTYRRQLMQLLNQATKHNIPEVLKDIQQATRLLEQQHFPDLDKLKQTLNAKIAQAKQAQQSQRKSEQFKRKLHELQMQFAPLSHLNNENVYNLAGILEHLQAQHINFHKVSEMMQQELLHLLKEARYILGQLQKEQQTTMKIAGYILTSESLNDLFSALDNLPPVLAQSPDLQVKHPDNLN